MKLVDTIASPNSMCFHAVMKLIEAARGVSASLDAIADLLGMLKDFTVRLKIYHRKHLSPELRGKLTEVLTTVFNIFARLTKVFQEGVPYRWKSVGWNTLLGNDQEMQGLVRKLDRLTEGEGRLIGAEALVEAKKSGRDIEGVRITQTANTTHLSQILAVIEDAKHRETVKKARSLPSHAKTDSTRLSVSMRRHWQLDSE